MSVVSESRRPVFPSISSACREESHQKGRQKESFRAAPELPLISGTSRAAARPTTVTAASKEDPPRDPNHARRAQSQGGTSHYEQEQLRRKTKRAEAMQREWDLIRQSERDRKKVILEQRVQIQRQLILKTDQLSKQLWSAVERKKLEEVEERRRLRQESIRALREHMRRVDEHKRKIAEKLREMGSDGDLTSQHDMPASSGHAEGPGSGSVDQGNMPTQHDHPLQQETDDIVELVKGPETSATVEEVWDNLRAKSVRKLQTITTRSNMLKKSISSPSAKLCLEIYERPTAHSSSTGKPVPFTELINESSEVREKAGAVQANLLAASLRLKEQKAQYMMSKKDTPAAAPLEGGGGPEWYGLAPLTLPDASSGTVTDQTSAPRNATMVPGPANGPAGDGDNGDGDDVAQTGEGGVGSSYAAAHSSGQPSVFITEPSSSSAAAAGSSCTTHTAAGWQPLSHSALAEYTSVSELPIHGLGELVHGKYKMWRPY